MKEDEGKEPELPVWADGNNCLISFYRLGQRYSGKLDYSIATFRVDELPEKEKLELILRLDAVKTYVQGRISALKGG